MEPDFALDVGRPSDRTNNPKLPVPAAGTDKSIPYHCGPIILPIKMLRHYSLQQKHKLAQPWKQYFRNLFKLRLSPFQCGRFFCQFSSLQLFLE